MGKLEKAKRLAQQSKTDVDNNIYINVCGVDKFGVAKMMHYEYGDEFNEIITEPEFAPFSDANVAKNVCVHYAELDNFLYVIAAVLVGRHLKSLSTELKDVIKEQKHNSFTIIVDTTEVYKAFVYSSTPADSKDYSKKHSALMYQSYNETINTI